MPNLTEALEIQVTVKIVNIEDALNRRDRDYRCPKCGKSIIPFKKSSTGGAAHFEHRPGQSCFRYTK